MKMLVGVQRKVQEFTAVSSTSDTNKEWRN